MSAAAAPGAAGAAPQAGRDGRLERLQALLLVLPAFVLAWPGPGGLLRGDPHPELAGTGAAALAALPAALLLLVRGAAPRSRAPWLLLVLLGSGMLALRAGAATDTQEAARAAILVTTGAVLLLGGASLGERGRLWLAWGLVSLSLLLLVPALAEVTGDQLVYRVFAPPRLRELLGPFPPSPLGNTGSTAEAAAPGALAGAWLAVRGRGAEPGLAALAPLAFAAYAGAATVWAAALALALGLGACLALARGARLWIAALALACAVAFLGARWAAAPDAPPAAGVAQDPAQPPQPAGELAGGAVRARVWRAALDLLRSSPWLGVGPGQFAARFPPFRDPQEIELSSHRRLLAGRETEVEHPHSDWLQAAVDAGAVGGLAFALLLGLAAARALTALRAEERARGALGAGVLALLVHATLREPLLFDPASSAAGFALLGGVLARPGARSGGGRLAALLVAALLAAQVGNARSLVRAGRSLARALAATEGATEHLARALRARPDSVLGRSLHARLSTDVALALDPPRPAAAIPAWEAVLALRPHRFEAWMALGRLHALAERYAQAREAMRTARALDPGHPGLLRNLALLEFRAGDVAAGLEALERLVRDGRLTPSDLEAWGASELQQLRPESGFALLARVDPRLAAPTPDEAYAIARALPEEREPLARALRGWAHLTWARLQAEGGDVATAVRSYRQADRNLRAVSPAGEVGARLALELAAALLLAGRDDEARAVLDAAEPSTLDLARLPEWAGEALLQAGWLGT